MCSFLSLGELEQGMGVLWTHCPIDPLLPQQRVGINVIIFIIHNTCMEITESSTVNCWPVSKEQR